MSIAKKLTTLGVAGLMILSVVGFGVTAPVYAQKPVEPGKSTQSNGKKYQQTDPIEVVVSDDNETTTELKGEHSLVNKLTNSTENKQKNESGNQRKVTICHRTNSAKNPYVVITVDSHAVDGVANDKNDHADHFGEHKGPIASSYEVAKKLKQDKIEWGDIIPPVAPHSGQNWSATGQAIWKNGCNYTTPSNPDDDGEVLSENPGKGQALPDTLPNTGLNSPALVLMMFAGIAALVGLGVSIIRLVQSRGL